MRVLVAPDKFRGTLTAAQAARAIAAGWARTRPKDDMTELPMADGGEGTLDALVEGLEGVRRRMRVTGPLGDPVDADYAWLVDADAPTALVEMSRASGLGLLGRSRLQPLRASTFGTGELILGACRDGAEEVIVCVGGSASTDAGAGMAQALGVRLLDATGRDIGRGGAALLDLSRIDLTTLDPAVRRTRFVVAADVDNPLVGPQGAAHVFGPQKGASPDEVHLLDRALAHFAAVAFRDLVVDVRNVSGAGAAGGLGAGLVAFLGAKLRAGVEVVMDGLGFQTKLHDTDLVITGEGKLDQQSLRGKVPAGVMAAARDAGVPAVIMCGRAELHPEGVTVASLVERYGSDRATKDARHALEDLAAEVAERASELSSRA